jgi:hypothetical protein
VSSQTAYGEFLLFASTIWWPDKEKYLLLRDCHYQTVRACHRTLDTRKLNWMRWPLRKDLEHKKIKLNVVTFEKGPGVSWWQYCGGRREAFMLHQQKVT